MSYVMTDQFSVKVTKTTSRTGVPHEFTVYLSDFNIFLTQ